MSFGEINFMLNKNFKMKRNYLIVFLMLAGVNVSFSQTESNTKDSTDKGKITISGYIQAQYQYFFIPDSIGGATPYFATFAGGNFVGRWSNNRFMIRSGRLKISHNTKYTEGVFSVDASERSIGVQDLYVKGTEPFLGAFSLTAGIQDRPFGYEIGYSSSSRETPERSRMIQTLFPYEKDLGAVLTFQMPEKNCMNFLRIDFGVMNGNGIATETDANKDMVGRIRISNPFKSKFVDYSIGFSFYNGYLNHISNVDGTGLTHKYLFKMGIIQDTASNMTTKGFVIDTLFGIDKKDSVKNIRLQTLGAQVDRKYLGFDAQCSFNFPWGKTTLRGEYIWGTQPSSVYNPLIDYVIYNGMTSMSPTGPINGLSFPNFSPPQANYAVSVKPTQNFGNTFLRNFRGYYFYFIQNILKTGHQIVVKFDYYDPNTAVSGKEIDVNYYKKGTSISKGVTGLSPADVAFWTLGLGYNYQFSKHLSSMLYYEMIFNEKTAIPDFAGNLVEGRTPSAGYEKNIKDNNFTIRLQYKF